MAAPGRAGCIVSDAARAVGAGRRGHGAGGALLVVFPLESLLCGFFAGKAGGFAWWFFLGAGVLFTSSIPMYYNTPSMYSYGGIYALLALAANAFGGYIASDKGTPDTNWKRKQAQKKASRPPKKLR